MSDIYWIGAATAVAQVTTIAVTAYDASTTYKITVGGVVISVVGSGGTTTTVATALAAAWNNSTHPYCTGVTASSSTNTVTLTADTAGVPFVITTSVSGGTGTIGSATTATANAGPNDWSTAANWSGGAVPANGDNVWLRNNSVSILWGLSQTTIAPALIAIEQSFTGLLGLFPGQFTTALGTYDTTVPEYRTSYLGIAAVAVRIGENYGSSQATGSSLLKLDLQSANANVQVFNCGQTQDAFPPIRLKMNHASATLKIYAGKVGVCWENAAETGQLSEIDVYTAGVAGSSAPEVYVGPGLTQATHWQQGGVGVLRNVPTTAKVESNATLTLASPAGGTITTIEKRGELTLAGTYAVTNLKG